MTAEQASFNGSSWRMTTGFIKIMSSGEVGVFGHHMKPLASACADLLSYHSVGVKRMVLLRKRTRNLSRSLVGEFTDFAIPTVLVLVPTILIVGLVVVLHGRKTGWSDLVRHRWRTITEISLVEICCGCLRDVFLDVISVIVAIGSWGYSSSSDLSCREVGLLQPYLYNSAAVNFGETLRMVEALLLAISGPMFVQQTVPPVPPEFKES
ncbi:hypothetical protein Tco_0631312 [Tanacetum coccineum]